eukprot:gene15958-biopygen16453
MCRSTYLVVPMARFYLRVLCFAQASKQGWGAKLKLSRTAWSGIKWWARLLGMSRWNGHKIWRCLNQVKIHTSASLQEVYKTDQAFLTRGQGSRSRSKNVSNVTGETVTEKNTDVCNVICVNMTEQTTNIPNVINVQKTQYENFCSCALRRRWESEPRELVLTELAMQMHGLALRDSTKNNYGPKRLKKLLQEHWEQQRDSEWAS